MAGEKEEEEEEAWWALAEGLVSACSYAVREIECAFRACQDAGVQTTYREYHYADRRGWFLFCKCAFVNRVPWQ